MYFRMCSIVVQRITFIVLKLNSSTFENDCFIYDEVIKFDQKVYGLKQTDTINDATSADESLYVKYQRCSTINLLSQ